MDKDIISVTDPRGITVACSERQWNEHITLPPHEYMPDYLQPLKDTLSAPDIIYESDGYTNRDVYFKSIGNQDEYLKAIVEVKANYGDVITAFKTTGYKGGINTEVIKYVKL